MAWLRYVDVVAASAMLLFMLTCRATLFCLLFFCHADVAAMLDARYIRPLLLLRLMPLMLLAQLRHMVYGAMLLMPALMAIFRFSPPLPAVILLLTQFAVAAMPPLRQPPPHNGEGKAVIGYDTERWYNTTNVELTMLRYATPGLA